MKRKANANGNDGGGTTSIQRDNTSLQITTAENYGSINRTLPIQDGNDGNDANGNGSDGTTSNHANNIISIPMTVEENYGSVSITLPIKEHITWRQGLCYCWLKCYKKYSSTCTYNACCQHHTTVSRQELVSAIEQDTTCASYLQDTRWKFLKKQGKEDDMAEADGEMIMLTYLGKKKNVRNVALSADRTIHLGEYEEVPVYVHGTQSYILLPAKFDPQEKELPTYRSTAAASVAHIERDVSTAAASVTHVETPV